MRPEEKRYPELDALRGIAVILMVLYHLLFNLSFLYGWNIPVTGDAGMAFVFFTASLFFLLVGICFVISWERRCLDMRQHVIPSSLSVSESVSRDRAGATRHDIIFLLYKKYLRRGLLIFSGGMLITLITWWATPYFFVKFGALHLIGLSTILLPFFVPLKQWNFLLGIVALLVPALPSLPHPVLSEVEALPPFLFPLGFPAPNFSSLDYFPLLPWFGVILVGMAVSNMLYVPHRHIFLERMMQRILLLPAPPLDSARGKLRLHIVRWMGRWSLWIYFVHQPVILLILSLILGMPVQR